MLTRTALAALLAAVIAGAFAASAPGAIAPTVTLNQNAGTTAGSSPATGFDINLRPFGSDSAKDIAITFPPGMMLNLQTAGGICLTSKVPLPACRLGGGTINGPGGSPVSLYLVAPLKATDIGGVALAEEGGLTTTGDLILETAPTLGEVISLRLLPPGIGELSFTLDSMRLPTTCGSEQTLAVAAATWDGFQGSATAPVSVTGCPSLPYAPKLSATATKQNGEEATVAVTFTQGAGESATGSLGFGIPTGMKLNRILLPCFQGTKCTIGSASAVSPLLPPAALGAGTLTLTGSLTGSSLYTPISGAALTLAFPFPYPFQFIGPVSLSERVITYSALPDIPFSTITFLFTGTSQGSAFTTPCRRSMIAATLTPQDGNAPVKTTAPVTLVGCPKQPQASGTLRGLAAHKPKLRLRVSAAADPADVSSLSITLPAGLRFSAGAIGHGCSSSTASRCKGIAVRGLQLAGTRVASARASGRSLRITFTHPTAGLTLSAAGPLVHETGTRARRKAGPVRVRITDAQGAATTVNLR